MMYIGEFLNSKFLGNLNKGLMAMAALFGLTVGALGIGTLMERGKIDSMKEEIENKSKSIVAIQEEAKVAKSKPDSQKVPAGLAAVGAFQNKLNILSKANNCAVTQFQAADQMLPFISTFSTATQPAAAWTQVDIRMNLQGSTRAVIGTLKELDTFNIPYEFTSLELTRMQASGLGEATISANVSLRVLTIPGGR